MMIKHPGSKSSLRRRLFLAMFMMLLAALSVASTAFYFMAEKLESTVLGMFLEQEMSVVKDHLARNPDDILPRISSLRVYRANDAKLPAAVRDLPSGHYHDMRIDGDRYEVKVELINGERLWLLFEINRIEAVADRLFMLVGMLFLVLSSISVWLSYRLAKSMASPVGRLADRVERLAPHEKGIRLAPEFRGEEVERIARAFDRYLERLEGFVDREQSFTAAASHELRTPLSVIHGATEILSVSITEPRLLKTLERIQRAGREMNEFIEALLSLSREEHADSYRAETRLDEICRNLCEDFATLLAQKPDVTMECDCNLPLAVAAPPALVTITISNLLRNAIEHTDSGHIEVRLDAGRRLTVRDTGRGIAPDALERIVERHFSTSGSTGMGLYLVRRICERYGWKLNINSTVGKGTTVVLGF